MTQISSDVVDFIFDQGRSASDRQLRDADALDAKATQVFGAASVIVGLAGFSHTGNAPLLIAAVGAYLVTAAAAGYGLWLAAFRVTDSPQQLLDRYWADAIESTKYAMVVDMAAGYVENERALGRKRRGVLVVLAATGVETALVGAAVIWTLLA